MACYCGLGQSFEACCQLMLLHHVEAETAEKLMRSRYSAYLLSDAEYLERTWHEAYCPDVLDLTEEVVWLGLEVLTTEAGLKNDINGIVEYKARYMQGGYLYCLHEKSFFEKVGGLWFYKKGDIYHHAPELVTMKQECPCGSGKKYKRCCFVQKST